MAEKFPRRSVAVCCKGNCKGKGRWALQLPDGNQLVYCDKDSRNIRRILGMKPLKVSGWKH